MIAEFPKKKNKLEMTTSRLRKKKHTLTSEIIAKAKKRKWLELSTPASDVCLNSGRPSENQALQECYIFTNLALVKE